MMCDGEKILQARYLFEAVLAGVCGAWARNNLCPPPVEVCLLMLHEQGLGLGISGQ